MSETTTAVFGARPLDGPDGLARADAAASVRLMSIDMLRGLAIVLMALDHVRDYFTGAPFQATDLDQTTPALFFTRWVTHFCAPVFVFLAGTGAFLLSRRATPAQTSRFLLTRGLWLIALEWTVVTFVWTFNFEYRLGLIMQVIWAIGVSMIVLAALIRLPLAAIAAIGVAMIAGHNLFDGVAPESLGAWAPLWQVLHVQGVLSFGATPAGFVHYPLIPWIGVMAAGYAFGRLYEFEAGRRRRVLVALGLGLCAAFVVLRLVNGYGDLAPWSTQRNATVTLLSFLNVTKYPPSLLFLLMTLGPAMLLLAWFERLHGPLAGMLATFGRVPLFAYVVHIVLAHLFAGLVALATGYGTVVLTDFFLFYPDGWGVGLPGVYLAWLIVLAVLYPLCRWFAAVRRRRGDWWLAYL